MNPRNIRITNLLGWVIACAGSLVYMLTMEPSASFWDCGEFIATSHKLMVGHPPGAPLYQLLAHCFMLLGGDNMARLAWWSNLLSALAGGLTAMFLFWTLVRLMRQFVTSSPILTWFTSLIGTACYLFCDTAWFSATESEVYSLSMLFSAAIIWATIRWAQCEDPCYAPRWLMLTALLLGLSVGVHMLSLLTLPTLILIYYFRRHKAKQNQPQSFVSVAQTNTKDNKARTLKTAIACMAFFVVGLSPYTILLIRAQANPPINMGNPSTLSALHKYFSRDQYEHAPLVYGRCYNSPIVGFEGNKPVYAKEMDMFFPRMWKRHEMADKYYSDWAGKHGKMVEVNMNPSSVGSDTASRYQTIYKPSFLDNMIIFSGYQLGYMYLRYLMWNFSGRYNDMQGFGNLQRGQFITGLPFIDRWYVGAGKTPPPSLHNEAHNRYFLLPFLLGIIGLFAHYRRDRRGFWVVMTTFLMSSLALSLYLNHPMYEPRERDYAYVLSFYAFAVWIGMGAFALITKQPKGKAKKIYRPAMAAILLVVPTLMACQNWDDHDRSGRYICRDTAANMLNSCQQGGILFTIGDNDTFPLWYLQYVEGFRTDVQVINVSLIGSDEYAANCQRQLIGTRGDLMDGDTWKSLGPYGRMRLILANGDSAQHYYFSLYCRDNYKDYLSPRTQLCGMVYHFDEYAADSVDSHCYDLLLNDIQWSPLNDVYVDATSRIFLRQYWQNVITTVSDLLRHNPADGAKATTLLDKAQQQVPLNTIHQQAIQYQAALLYLAAGQTTQAYSLLADLKSTLDEQLRYYGAMSPAMQQYVSYEIEPLVALRQRVTAIANMGR